MLTCEIVITAQKSDTNKKIGSSPIFFTINPNYRISRVTNPIKSGLVSRYMHKLG